MLAQSAPRDAALADAGTAESATIYQGLTPQRMARIQRALQRDKLDGWPFFDFRRSDGIAYRLPGPDPRGARAADRLSADLEAVAQEAARRVREDRPATERELQEFARARWAQEGFETEGWPGVAVDAHTADPHYSPLAEGGTVAGRNSLLLLDFSARLAPAGIYGDLTRV